jgi:hypothetical protein
MILRFCSCGCGKILKRYKNKFGKDAGYGSGIYAPDCDRKFTEEKSRNISSVDLSWVAGIIEGEGHIGIANPKVAGTTRRRYVLGLCVDNTDYRIIDKLHNLFGGYVGVNNRKIVKDKNAKWQFRWQVSSVKAATILRIIQPFVVSKIEEVNLGIEFYLASRESWQNDATKPRLEPMRLKMLELHKRRPEPTQDSSLYHKYKKSLMEVQMGNKKKDAKSQPEEGDPTEAYVNQDGSADTPDKSFLDTVNELPELPTSVMAVSKPKKSRKRINKL